MSKKRVRPEHIGSHLKNTRLSTKRSKEVRLSIYHDQWDLLDEYSRMNGIHITTIIRKFIAYFLHMTEAQRQAMLKGF